MKNLRSSFLFSFISICLLFIVLFFLLASGIKKQLEMNAVMNQIKIINKNMSIMRHLSTAAFKKVSMKGFISVPVVNYKKNIVSIFKDNAFLSKNTKFWIDYKKKKTELDKVLENLKRGLSSIVIESVIKNKRSLSIVVFYRTKKIIRLTITKFSLNKLIPAAIKKYKAEIFVILAGFFVIIVSISAKVINNLIKRNLELKNDLLKLSFIDPETGLYNHIYFNSVFEREVNRSKRYAVPLSLALLDIDGLKMINEFYERNAGDEAIKMTAEYICNSIRVVDYICYLGGGQYAVILPNTDSSGASILSERLRADVEGLSFEWNGREVAVTISIGIGQYSEEHKNAAQLFNDVEKCLEKAKKTGRNKIC